MPIIILPFILTTQSKVATIIKMTTRSKKNIVLLVPGFPKDEDDSVCIPALQQYALQLIRQFPDARLSVIAFQYPFTNGKYRWHGAEVYACGGNSRRRLGRIFTWLKAAIYFLRIHFGEHVSTIHSFWLEECAFCGQYLAKLLKIKHVATIMGQDARPGNIYLKHLDFQKMTVTCPSQFSADILKSAHGKTVQKIIPIGLDTGHFSPPESSNRDIDILGAGALISLKNYRLFVNIIADLIQNFPDLKSVIIGDGEEFNELSDMIKKRRLQKNIRLTGQLPRAAVIQYMYRSKIFLHPSTYESQGYVFPEALYCGMTIVSFPVGIAEPSDRFWVCNDEMEMHRIVKQLLTKKFDYQPLLLKAIDETVMEYWELYH